MQPWKVSIGLTVTALGVVALLGLPELSWLRPHWRVLVRDYWLPVSLYGGLAVASFRILDLCRRPLFGAC